MLFLCGRSALIFALGVLVPPLSGAEPTLSALFPAGAREGTELTVQAEGKFDPWPVEVWTSGSGLRWVPEEKAGQFKVRVEAAAGPQWVRFYNAQGASDLRLFSVGRLPESTETEPNNRHGEAMEVSQVPLTINGRLDKPEDVDCFLLRLEAGQCLVAAVDGFGLRSPIDPLLHLFDESNRRVAFAHDSRNLDPLLVYQAERDGIYVLQLSAFAHPPEANVRFAGSAAAVYRLTLTTGPFGHHAVPTAVPRAAPAVVAVHGWNLEPGWNEVSVPPSYAERVDVASRDWPRSVHVDVSDARQIQEQEPNGTQPMRVEKGSWIHGRLDPAGDQDRYGFRASAGEAFRFRVDSLALGFPADTVLILEGQGGELARSDDQGEDRDPSLDWTAKTEGDYVLCVKELFGRGGDSFVYRLVVEGRRQDFTVSAAQTSIKVAKGKEAELKIKVDRMGGHAEDLFVHIEGLPEGVTLKPVEVPAKNGEVPLKLVASDATAQFSGPVRLLVSEAGDGRSRAAWVDLREDQLRGDMLLNGTDILWLTVE